MSKTWIGVLVALVVIVGGYYFFLRVDHTETSTEVKDTTEETPEAKKMAFVDLIKQGGSYKCTVNLNQDANTTTVGTYYMDHGMARGEYSTKTGGMNIDMNIIMRDGYGYMWNSMTPKMGFKSKMDAGVGTGGDGTAPVSGSIGWNNDQFGDYNCEAWTADASKFVLPTTVTFRDMASVGQQ